MSQTFWPWNGASIIWSLLDLPSSLTLTSRALSRHSHGLLLWRNKREREREHESTHVKILTCVLSKWNPTERDDQTELCIICIWKKADRGSLFKELYVSYMPNLIKAGAFSLLFTAANRVIYLYSQEPRVCLLRLIHIWTGARFSCRRCIIDFKVNLSCWGIK